MKVLIAGEATIHLQNYCRAIKKHVEAIILLTETPTTIPEASQSYIVSFRENNPVKWLMSKRKIKRILSKEKPNLIHLHQINRLAYFIASVAGTTPIISTAWGSDVLLVPQKNRLYKNICCYILAKSKYVTADADIMIEAMNKLLPDKEKYIHLQYGINPVQPATKEKIIFSNRSHKPLYNIEKIILDFDAFCQKHPDWKLHIGGAGIKTENLKALALQQSSAKNICFLGWLNEEQNHKEYAKASIYVTIPSSDGTSISLLEAMSANCIPVVSDLPANKEWIENGVTGIIRKDNTNPFEEALKLNQEKCFFINQERIKKDAVRSNTTGQFYNLYCKAIYETIHR